MLVPDWVVDFSSRVFVYPTCDGCSTSSTPVHRPHADNRRPRRLGECLSMGEDETSHFVVTLSMGDEDGHCRN